MPCVVEVEPEKFDPVKNPSRGHLTAYLCGLLRVAERTGTLGNMIALFDAKEAGISQDMLAEWWVRHRAEDEKRRLAKAKHEERVRRAEDKATQVRRELFEELKKEFGNG